MKVMIVDDDVALCQLLKQALQVSFYAKAKLLARDHKTITESLEVEQFAEQEEALRFLQTTQEHVDLIFTEIHTPGMADFEFIRVCRNQYKDKCGDVIVVTDRDDKQDIKTALQAGARDYILKPFAPEDLMEHVFQAWE